MSDPNAPTPAEQLARMFHDAYGRFAEQFASLTITPYDQAPLDYRKAVVAASGEIIEAILEGKIIEYDDPGDKLAMLLSKTGDGKIRVDFQKPLKWFALGEPFAIHFALTILQHCGIPVQVNIAPVPGAPESGKPV